MLLENELVEITINGSNAKRYQDLGYDIPMHIGSKGKPVFSIGEKIFVKVSDLSPKSSVRVKIRCDYCGEIYTSKLNNYKKNQNTYIKKDCCKKCRNKKVSETILDKYGGNSILSIPEFKEKAKQTNLKKYGCEYAIQNPEVKKKVIETMNNRYGVDYPIQNKDIQNTMRNTMKNNYGVEYSFQSQELREKFKDTMNKKYNVDYGAQIPWANDKRKQTCLETYGVDNPMKNADVKNKQHNSMYQNNSAPCSSQQRYINSILGGKLNYPFKYYSLDIFKEEDKIVVEYNGSGHDLCVKLGHVTKEDFDRKELIRQKNIKDNGYRLITLISSNDKLPKENEIIKIYEDSKEYFNSTGHTWRTYNFDFGLSYIDATTKENVI